MEKRSVVLMVYVLLGQPVFGVDHQFGDYLISVSSDRVSILSENDYTVSVSKAGLLLSRLTVACDDSSLVSFVSDLDSDKQFEVIVTSGGKESLVDLYTWTGDRLKSLKIPEVTIKEKSAGELSSFYTVSRGRLFKKFELKQLDRREGKLRYSYVYSVTEKKWLFEK